MTTSVIRRSVTNFLVCAGAFYISLAIGDLLQRPFGKLTNGIIYSGHFAGSVLLPLVLYAPRALCAFGVGALVFWLVESRHPILWAVFPAMLYFIFRLQYYWARPPVLFDREFQLIGALFPAVACVLGALTVRWRIAPRGINRLDEPISREG